MIAKVLIDTNVKTLNRVYDYVVPKSEEENIEIGMRVNVNFGQGKGNMQEGIVVKLENSEDNVKENTNGKKYKLKEIAEVLDTESYLDSKRLKLGKWISRMYFCNVYDALRLMLPPGTRGIDKSKDIKEKQVIAIRLIKNREDIETDIELGKISKPKHIKLVRFLIDNDYTLMNDIISGLEISRAVIATVEKNGYIEVVKMDNREESTTDVQRTVKLVPTERQKQVIDSLIQKVHSNEASTSLIYGITGSGKTEVYLQVIEECLNVGKSAIVLVPEISLTYQTKNRFVSRFGDVVSVLHSKMTVAERKLEWKRIKEGKTRIVIGPRSALFVPIQNLGLVIIDEEHDSSYNSQTTPRYITREVAEYISKEYSCPLVFGSATPSIPTMYKANQGLISYYELLSRPGTAIKPDIFVADMKEEAVIGNRLFSTRLKEEIAKNLERKEKTFIFLNRRGFASYLICKECGTILKCRNCDVNLTYHKKSDLLLCHYCSYVENKKSECPVCGSNKVEMGSAGTQNVEEQIKDFFPMAKVLRMDMDTTIKRGQQEKILNDFKDGDADILVGTQMISKGHDIEDVTLVGVLNVDGTEAGNDYMSSENAFQNLLQVVGRCGRGRKKGRAIVQAYNMESNILECLKTSDYMQFYTKEIEYRKAFEYPPFTDILVIELNGEDKNMVMQSSNKLYEILMDNDNNFKVYSPKSPFIQKIRNKYRVQMVVKVKICNENLDLIYEKLRIYDKIKKRGVGMSITKNPTHVG